MKIEFDLAYEFVRQGIWDEYDFIGFVLTEIQKSHKALRRFK